MLVPIWKAIGGPFTRDQQVFDMHPSEEMHDLLSWSGSESEGSLIDEGYDEPRVEDEDWEIAERGELCTIVKRFHRAREHNPKFRLHETI